MLYKFKSAATGDLIMLEPHGRRVLQIIGKDPGAQGIVTAAQIPGAIAALQKAVADEGGARAAAPQPDADADAAEDPQGAADEAVALRQRVAPFIEMLQRAHAEHADVVWGV